MACSLAASSLPVTCGYLTSAASLELHWLRSPVTNLDTHRNGFQVYSLPVLPAHCTRGAGSPCLPCSHLPWRLLLPRSTFLCSFPPAAAFVSASICCGGRLSFIRPQGALFQKTNRSISAPYLKFSGTTHPVQIRGPSYEMRFPTVGQAAFPSCPDIIKSVA